MKLYNNREELNINKPFFSIIIPVYNGEKYIKKCLDSLINQNYPKQNYEIIVVDNDSQDSSTKIIGVYAEDYNVKIFTESKRGSYAARNLGIVKSKGEYIAFIDVDCCADPNWLLNAAASFKSPKQKKIVSGNVIFMPESKLTVWGFFDKCTFLKQEKAAKLGRSTTANMFTSKSVLEIIGLFDDSLLSGGDMEWTSRATNNGIVLEYNKNVKVFHPIRNSLKEISKKSFRVGIGIGQLVRSNKRKTLAIFRPGMIIPVIKNLIYIFLRRKKYEKYSVLVIIVSIYIQLVNYAGKLKGYFTPKSNNN